MDCLRCTKSELPLLSVNGAEGHHCEKSIKGKPEGSSSLLDGWHCHHMSEVLPAGLAIVTDAACAQSSSSSASRKTDRPHDWHECNAGLESDWNHENRGKYVLRLADDSKIAFHSAMTRLDFSFAVCARQGFLPSRKANRPHGWHGWNTSDWSH